MSEFTQEEQLEEVAVTNGRAEGEPVAEATSSHLARLRKRHEQLQGDHSIDLAIPGYDGELVCRYKPVSWDELKKVAERVEKMRHPQRELLGQADMLIAACDSFWVCQDGKLEPLDPDDPEPIRYDARLAKAMGFEQEANSAREVVLKLFVYGLAVTAHHNELAEWMQDVSTEVDEQFLGES